MFPGHSPDHQAPSGNPKTKPIGAEAARRRQSSSLWLPWAPLSHTEAQIGASGQAFASDHTSRETSNQHSGHNSIWLQSVASLHLQASPFGPGLQHPAQLHSLCSSALLGEVMKLLLLTYLHPALWWPQRGTAGGRIWHLAPKKERRCRTSLEGSFFLSLPSLLIHRF